MRIFDICNSNLEKKLLGHLPAYCGGVAPYPEAAPRVGREQFAPMVARWRQERAGSSHGTVSSHCIINGISALTVPLHYS